MDAESSLRSTMIGDYSAIGFGKSMTEAFDELRTEQDRIVACLKSTIRTFRELKKKDGQEEEGEEDEFKDLSESIATSRYCEDRERIMDSLRQWTFDAAYQISDNYVDAEKDADRIQRILDFINKAKTMLRLTTPLGRQTEERAKDAQFLALFATPEDILEMGRVVRKHMEEQARVMNDSKVTPKTGSKKGIGASTLISGSARYSLRTLRGRKRGSASSTPAREEMAPQGSSTPDLKYGNIKERRNKHAKERQEKKMTAFRLEEEVEKRSTATEEVVVTESGTDSEEESEEESVQAGEKTRNHMTLNDLENEGVLVDNDVIMQKLAEERQRLKEETEAAEKQEEEERIQLEELERREEEERERIAHLANLQRKREEKEASDAKSRELRKEIAALEKKTEEAQKRREESTNRVEERKEAARKKEKEERKRIIELSKKEEEKREKEDKEEEKEEEEEEEERPWVPVTKKKKRESTDSEELPERNKADLKRKEEEKRGGGRGGVEAYWGIQQETLARQRILDARPKNDEERFGDDAKMSYMAFKRKFRSATNVKGINQLDVLNEIFFWLRGTPKTVAEPFKEIEDPEEALAAIWENLDSLFALKKLTPEERMKKAMKRPAVVANDLESIIGMLSVLQGIWYEAKTTKSESGLNKDEIVRDLVNEKLGFMAKSFYKKQYKLMKTEPLCRRGFVDVIEDLQEEAQILKARGLASKPPTGKEKESFVAVVNLAPAQVSDGPRTFSDVVAKSPPKAQPPLPVKEKCEFCENEHRSENVRHSWR